MKNVMLIGLEEKMMKKFKVSPDGRFIVFIGKAGGLHLLSAKASQVELDIRKISILQACKCI